MKSIQRNQGGFSLVEILLVLGIIAILAIAAFIIFPQVQASNRANTEQSNVTTITAGTKNLFGATRDYKDVTNGVINQARVFPASMNGGVFTPTAAISSSWSADVDVEGDNCSGTTSSTAGTKCFHIAYTDMPSEVCTKLVPGLVQNFKAIYIGTPGAGTLASDPATVVGLCNGGATPASTVNVMFVSE